jgi:hypothetical protein
MGARTLALGLMMLFTVACAGGTATPTATVRPDHNLGVGGAPTPGGPDALAEPDGPALAVTAADGVLTVSLDSAGGGVRAVELRLIVVGDATLTLIAPAPALGLGPLVTAQTLADGLLLALARVGGGPSDPVDGALARVRYAGTGTVRVEAAALDDALEPLTAIAPAQALLTP